MSLNSDVMDDLGGNDGVDPEGVIQTPAIMNQVDETVTIVAQDIAVNQVENLTPDAMAKLPTMDVAFQVVSDGVTKVIDLKDVESEILAHESICQSQAENIHAVFENFVGVQVRLSEFTKSPTKTNLAYTKKFMKTRIAKEEASVVAKFQVLIDQPLEDGKNIISNLVANYLPTIYGDLFQLKTQALGLNEALKVNKNLVVPYDQGFTNVATIAFTELDFTKLNMAGIDVNQLNQVVQNIVHASQYNHLTSFIHGCIGCMSLDYIFSNEAKVDYAGKPLTAVQLVQFYQSDLAQTYVHDAVEMAEQAVRELEAIQEASDKHKDSFDGINNYLIAEGTNIQATLKGVHNLVHIAAGMLQLNLNAAALFAFFSKL